MLRIEVQFLTGRYHATPWSRHVNEGAVEWPPSPWRVLRALIATGFSKLEWSEIPVDARRALEALASAPPVFYLPPASAGHTRHYMPLGNFKDGRIATSKVLDAFAAPGKDAPLVIEWPAELAPADAELVAELFARMSYLGRAESWIEARRVDEASPSAIRCEPIATAQLTDPDTVERVELLAPMAPPAYAEWRADARAREQARRLAAKRAATKPGKKRPAALSKKDLARLDGELPDALTDALCADTPTLRKAGWSQPPGSRWVTYLRARGALDGTPPRARRARRAGRKPDTALLALVSDTVKARHLPPMRDAVARCEMLHQTLVSLSDAGDAGAPSPCFTGCDAEHQPLRGHRHSSLLALALEPSSQRRGHIDHVLVHAPMGFDDAALAALRRVRETYAKGHTKLFVTLAGVGRRDEFAGDVPHVRESIAWVSATPFVPPRYVKRAGKNALTGQVLAELASRDLPPARVEIEVHEDGEPRYVDADAYWALRRGSARIEADGPPLVLSRRWRHFRKARTGKTSPAPPRPVGVGLRLVFERPVAGPISLGYASHFGLGNFQPE